MKAYDKYRLKEVDGAFSKDLKPVKLKDKTKILSEDYVDLLNKNKFNTGIFYVENKEATKEFENKLKAK